MVVHESQTWITSVIDDQEANKAVVLAASLRKVLTRRKIVVIFSPNISKDTRDLLRQKFDLTVLIDENKPDGVDAREFAKIFAFSFNIFSKCVYLSASTLVLQNCDEIFDKYNTSLTVFSNNENENGVDVDTSVFVFTPSFSYYNEMRKLFSNGQVWNATTSAKGSTEKFSEYFGKWLLNQNASSGFWEEKYNRHLSLMDEKEIYYGLESDLVIINFIDVHPIEMADKLMENSITTLGIVESFVVNTWMQIYMEEFIMKTSAPSLEIQPDSKRTSAFGNDPIAIVGMSCRYPGANNVDEFWSLIIEGREGIKTLPHHRWTTNRALYKAPNRNIEAGFLNVPIDEFDAKFFNISPKESVFLDPQQRLLHEVTWEAFEDAAIDPLSLRGTNTGVFVGSWLQDYKDIACRSVDLDFFRTYMGTSIASGAARISYFLETTGPSIATESGCSSAIVAVDLACKSLRNHDSNLTVACGVNLLIHPFDQHTLSFVIAPDGRCKTFDSKANGFGRAEACATLLLKRLSDAVKDENKIWGLVRGSAVTQEGISKSLGTPTVHCEALAMELALKDAGVEPKDVGFLETHGTGTPVGDPMEIAAIAKVYSKGRNEPLVIGSVKTNVGHTESASGITGIIKVLLSMQNETIPPHLNLETINPEINLDLIPARIPMSPIPWPRNGAKPRIAGVSSFGISGTDGHAIIEEAPFISRKSIDFKMERPLHFMKISAKSPESMDTLLENYNKMLKQAIEDGQTELAHFAYSANTGRATFNHRAVIIAKDLKDASKIIQDKSYKINDVQANGSQLCFLFTGQGSQYPKMAEEFYTTSPVFKHNFDRCIQVLENKYNISIRDVMWGSSQDVDKLSRTLYSQTSIFCVEYCLLKLWESWGVKPDFVLGHSLGEFAAAVAAGALNFEDALMLVAERSRLIDNLPRGKMLVFKSDKKTVDTAIAEFKGKHSTFWVDFAALNSPDQTVVAGDSQLIEDFAKFCEEKSVKSIILASSHAFHSRHMDPMLQSYREAASKVIFNSKLDDNSYPRYISGMEGKLLEREDIDADYWVRHTREKVSFMDACKVAQSEGCTLFIEVGPHPVLSALAMMNIDGTQVKCLPSIRRKENDWETILESLAKLYFSEWKGQIDWTGFDKFYQRQRVSLPFYPFNRKPAWHKIRAIHATLHPLLGKILPSAVDRTVYENCFLLKNVNFVQEHVIGDTVVMPGAGFLEMCLTGGHCSVQGFTEDLLKPRRPIILKSLKIALPLALYDSEPCQLQTVIFLDDKEEKEIGYSVNVYRQNDADGSGTGQWISHASATFLPVAPASIPELSLKINIPEIINSWPKSDSKDFYEKLPEVGLRFGPKFQCLEAAWKSENSILLKVKVPEDHAAYLIHPIVADAMIQAIMLWTSKEGIKKKLQVPVQVGQFIWVASFDDPSNVYGYCANNEEGKPFCSLVDGNGTCLALMSEVDFIETTVKLVEGMIQQQSVAMPKLWEDVWKNAPGPLQNSFPLAEIDPKVPSEEEEQKLKELNDIGEDERRVHENMDALTRAYFLDALYQLGWNPQPDLPFTIDDLMSILLIGVAYKKFVEFFMRNLAEKGILEETKYGFCWKEQIPNNATLFDEIKKRTLTKDFNRLEYKLLVEIGKSLADILRGKVEPLQILFPEDSSKPSAFHFYDSRRPFTSRVIQFSLKAFIVEYVSKSSELFRNSKKPGKPVFRVLEIGAGTGTASQYFVQSIDEIGWDFEYYYTDLSAVFFNSAAEKLHKFSRNIIFKKYNMDEDPLHQGLCPQYFDLIIALEAVHVAKDLRKTLKYIRSILKPGGVFQIVESITPDPIVTFLFGVLPGYWQNEDTDFRPNHITLTGERWKEVLTETKFKNIIISPSYDSVHGVIQCNATLDEDILSGIHKAKYSWIIFDNKSELCELLKRKLTLLNRDVMIIQPFEDEEWTEASVKASMNKFIHLATTDEKILEGIIYLWSLVDDATLRDQRKLSLPFISLCQRLTELVNPPRVYAITRGACNATDTELINPNPCTILGILKSLGNEQGALKLNHLDLDPSQPIVEQATHIYFSLWQETPDFICLRGEKRVASRLTSVKIQKDDLNIPNGCDRFQLLLPKTRLISDLEFGFLDHYELAENEVEVQIKTMALNFRDVFAVLKPIADFETFNAVGLDWAGVVTKVGSGVTSKTVGDRVMGMNVTKTLSLPSHYKADQDLLIEIPTKFTFAEVVTLPAVFSTAVYCLINIAKMKRGDTILIHTASGGVGLCAIQLAQQVGADIIATAGSVRKRNFLRNLGIQHVFHSRTTEFGKQILEVTNGKGVDIVLNSITGEGFKEASLGALAKKGRFIEMSKLNVWGHEEVDVLRPDVFYAIVDLTTLKKPDFEKFSETLRQYLSSSTIRPLPYERFDAVNIRGALNYLQKAKHIGKIVCVMPEVKVVNSKFTTTTPLFNPESTYLVTGGLGGIGFEVVKWILRKGGKHVAIASRSAPFPDLESKIQEWNANGAHIQAFSVDVGDYEQCRQLLKSIKSPELGFPPLRGVMHAAGVLSNNLLDNQTWEKFELTYNPKVNGSWNLHDLTKDYLLEHFVLFSSMAATLGSPGQTNHAGSNSFEDGLAHYRHSQGLTATCVNWGNWGEVGVATEIDFPGLRPISTSEGLLALETFLTTQRSHLAVLNIESFAMLCKVFPRIKTYIDDKRLLGESKVKTIISSDEFWAEVDKSEDREGKLLVFKNFIKTVIRNTLKLDADEVIDDHADLQTLGIDSLMSLEMKNAIQNVFGARVSLTAATLKDCNTADILSNRLVDILEGNEETASIPTQEELKLLIREDSCLPEHIKLAINANIKPISEITTVLLTGCTGTLGPYTLRDLSNRPSINKIYCLVRKSGKLTTLERVKKRLQDLKLLDQVNMSKVEYIQGDITSSYFGLAEEDYHKLCEEVDAIIHNAVRADHQAKYWKSPETFKSTVRNVNVKGAVRILEFSLDKTIKHVFYASSLLTVVGVSSEGTVLTEDWQDIEAYDDVTFNSGYPLSKFIAEQLFQQAIERGIPCKVFRFGCIAGESKTGRCDFESNHCLLRWLAFLKLRVMPDLCIPAPVIPVDRCSSISLDVFFNQNAKYDVYNLGQHNCEIEQVLIHVAKELGVDIEPVSFEEFVEKLKEEDSNSPLAPFVKEYVDIASTNVRDSEGPMMTACRDFVSSNEAFFQNHKIIQHVPNYNAETESTTDVMRRDLNYLKGLGIFEKFGIVTK